MNEEKETTCKCAVPQYKKCENCTVDALKRGKEIMAEAMKNIPKNWVNEDQIPVTDMTAEEYGNWVKKSRVVLGVRMGPAFKRRQIMNPQQQFEAQRTMLSYYNSCGELKKEINDLREQNAELKAEIARLDHIIDGYC